jgi:hypothetical protein
VNILVKGEKYIFASSGRIAGKTLYFIPEDLMVNCYFLKKQIAQRRLKKEKNTTKLV